MIAFELYHIIHKTVDHYNKTNVKKMGDKDTKKHNNLKYEDKINIILEVRIKVFHSFVPFIFSSVNISLLVYLFISIKQHTLFIDIATVGSNMSRLNIV